MKVHLLYFASLREALGPEEWVDVPSGSTVADVRALLVQRKGLHAEALASERAIRCAVNQLLCAESQVLAEGAELAFFPPVTGG